VLELQQLKKEQALGSVLHRQSSSHPLRGPKPALGVSAKVARGVIRDCMSRKHKGHWQPICG
jgi:hypothetical protein